MLTRERAGGLEPMVERLETESASGPLIRNISDTALWVAVYRARETERPDALFRDPLARKLAGERGEQIARSMEFGERHAWSYVARTWLVDRIVTEQVTQGTEMVVNLAAGLDTRPYRMDLPRSLRWIEVDLPGMIDYKEQVLGGSKAACELKRVRLDLSNLNVRRELFADLGRSATKVLVLSEGLIIYLTRDEVGTLARDLAAQPSFQSWVLDLVSPGLLKMLQKNLGGPLTAAGSPLECAWRRYCLSQTAGRVRALGERCACSREHNPITFLRGEEAARRREQEIKTKGAQS